MIGSLAAIVRLVLQVISAQVQSAVSSGAWQTGIVISDDRIWKQVVIFTMSQRVSGSWHSIGKVVSAGPQRDCEDSGDQGCLYIVAIERVEENRLWEVDTRLRQRWESRRRAHRLSGPLLAPNGDHESLVRSESQRFAHSAVSGKSARCKHGEGFWLDQAGQVV